MRVHRTALLVPLACAAACVERTPSVLVPLTDEITLRCPETGAPPPADMTISNRGDREITVEGGAFEAVEGAEGEEQLFEELLFEWPTERDSVVPPNEQMLMRFRYACPDGRGPDARIVITSDAEENPRLEILVRVLDAQEPVVDAGSPDAGTDGEDDDAGAASEADAGA